MEKADIKSGSAVAGGVVQRNDENYVGLIRKMNYYASGEVVNYLLILINIQELNEGFLQNSGSRQTYLIEEGGQLLAASDPSMVGRNISVMLPKWRELTASGGGKTVYLDDQSVICMSMDVGLGMRLIMTEDQASLLEEAEGVTRRILVIFAVSSLLV